MLRLSPVAMALVCVMALVPASATASTAKPRAGSATLKMLAKVNKTRAAHGLRAVKLSPGLTRGCRSYASTMVRTDRWGHARDARGKEILALTRGRTGMNWVVKAWLRSSVHRKVLLGRSYRRVGIARKKGRMNGGRVTVWVLRFAR
jgi:uncharacterized protein YkwD